MIINIYKIFFFFLLAVDISDLINCAPNRMLGEEIFEAGWH